MKLSDNLKRIRRDNNLSQEQLAEKLGVSRQAVSKWESGQSYPEMDKVLLICKLFNYNIDELMNENVKEVDETKQSKININKYIDDFFVFITKTVDVFSSMRFRDRLKCFIENLFMCLFMLVIYLIISAIGGSVFANTFGSILPYNIYIVIINILEALCTILYLIITVTVLLHIFKIRYLDYFEIIKENDNEEPKIDTNIQTLEEKSDEKRKIFIEKKKEKIIIRDPEHSQSKFLTGLFRIILAFIKFMAVCMATAFIFSFIVLFCLLVLSFMFVKTGLIFWGSFFAIVSGIIINYIVLEWFYNFIVSKKSKRTRMAISFVVALVLAGISIGMILIGVTQFTIVEDNSSSFEVEDIYEYEMTENLSLSFYNCSYKYIETDSNKVKIAVKHTKFTRTQVSYYMNDFVEIYCYNDGVKTIDLIKTIIKDLNKKELKDYPGCAEVEIYASKENIEKIKENGIKKYNLSRQKELEEALQLNQELETDIIELEETIQTKENIIESLELEIEEKENIINSLQETNEIENQEVVYN